MNKPILSTLIRMNEYRGYVLVQDVDNRFFTLTPKQFSDERLSVLPRRLHPPMIMFDPEVLLID